jgi:hypothetical protein
MSETSSEEFDKISRSNSDESSSYEIIPLIGEQNAQSCRIKRRNCIKMKIKEHAYSHEAEG